ncbi:Integral membrane protein DGCR2/IDD [Araneus ventricosus]|uniref:Integral membrane protein DGCR2/IDD n=1 Tax=Araneus ventricosus TaxID=182803 RepID=A0A4Y2MRY8_ARAVE|nr:Integral membrane protein DGCR2/IDD [Araneus ventricosus]
MQLWRTDMNVLISSIVFSFILWSPVDMSKEAEVDSYQHCLDHKGKEVSHGDRFFPLGSDPCTQCTCLNGKPQMCIAVFCSPPENCRQYHALSDKCCEFVCLDRDFPNKASGNSTYPDTDTLSTTNLGLRLVASTVTSFLILALLLFMIHRLRQRRLLLMIRRFHARRMDNGNAHLSRRFSEDDDGSVGYFVGHDQLDFSRYDEPPPPYTLWKPPEMYIPPGEAPPPYDLSVQLTAPYTSSFSYAPNEQVSLTTQQAIISVHAENQESSSHEPAAAEQPSSASQNENIPGPNCSICTAVDIELNNMANSTGGAVLPPDIQYEESCSYLPSNNTTASRAPQAENTVINSETRDEEAANSNVAGSSSSCNDNAIATTSTSCTCTLVSKKGKSKRHSCCEFADDSRPRTGLSRNNLDNCCSMYSSTSQENNNLYPDPTAWCGEASESSSSSSPTYDQPTLSPSTSDSSSADADFSRDSRLEHNPAAPMSFRTLPSRSSRNLGAFENPRIRDLPEDGSKAPHFQKTLSNLKKFSLIKRKKKKRRLERPNEISCSFVCQSVTDGLPSAHQSVFEDGMDLTSRNSAENVARPLEAINPHIGHKLASSGLRSNASRPTTISIPGQAYRLVSRRKDGSGPSFISYADVHCCSSVVTVSGGTIEGSCAACCNASSPDSICDGRSPPTDVHTIQSSRSLNRQGISRSGSICSETGERRYHRSAGSSPTTARSSHALDTNRFLDSRYASSSHIVVNDRTMGARNSFQNQEDGNVRHIPVWVVNSVAIASRPEYDIHSSAVRRSASGSLGESSRSVGDISSPLDFRDSMLSSGSSWEACSHL